MPIRQLVINATDGLHARPAADLARLAHAHPDPVSLTTTSGVTVDVGSVLAVMDLALSPGDAVRMETCRLGSRGARARCHGGDPRPARLISRR